jgi:AraC family transcriptional regulator
MSIAHGIIRGSVVQDQSALTIHATPPEIFGRKLARWRGLHAESVEHTRNEPYEFRYDANPAFHLLLLTEQMRSDGETMLEGLPKSTLRNSTDKLTLVPAGHAFSGWSNPRVLGRATMFYIDPCGPLVDPELRFSEIECVPRLFFDDSELRQTVHKLKAQIFSGEPGDRLYAEALGVVLVHELVRLNAGRALSWPPERGGLCGWQRRRIAEYIEGHLADDISLATLAELVKLSPYHFARSFKHSFGMPPHRYHTHRRIERAKALLADPRRPIAVVASAVGFHSNSAFTAAFIRSAGQTPSFYRRNLD